MNTIAFIGLGSNLDDPERHVRTAICELDQLPASEVLAASPLYRSAPMGPQDQDDYINAVVQLRTQLAPLDLLDQLQRLENQHGRVRLGERWGPRTLDLDLLLYGDKCIDLPRLKVPHYGITERNFVVLPLFDIAPKLIFPDGTPLLDWANRISKVGIEKLS
jgi:2-amino-4-hydroxy-6-hydroxymethyldihydropteridine diphosphokinase